MQAAALLQLLLTYITAFLFYRDPASGRDMTALEMQSDNTMGVVLIMINCVCFVVIVIASIYFMQEVRSKPRTWWTREC